MSVSVWERLRELRADTSATCRGCGALTSELSPVRLCPRCSRCDACAAMGMELAPSDMFRVFRPGRVTRECVGHAAEAEEAGFAFEMI